MLRKGRCELAVSSGSVGGDRTTLIGGQGYGGFAVVDVDTLWRNRNTNEFFHWKGRVCDRPRPQETVATHGFATFVPAR